MQAADPREEIPDEAFLALCADPVGVSARVRASKDVVLVLRDAHAALIDAMPGDVEPVVTIPTDADARIPFALALIARTAISLIEGIHVLLPSNAYAASALVRQLVEVEYLAWAVANEPSEIVDWLLSDRTARRKRWSPKHLRDRSDGRFGDSDYWFHCELGGHPTPAGILILSGPTERDPQLAIMPEVTHYETTLHAVAICDYVLHGIPGFAVTSYVGVSRAHAIRKRWQDEDPATKWSKLASAGEQGKLELMALVAQSVMRMLEQLTDD